MSDGEPMRLEKLRTFERLESRIAPLGSVTMITPRGEVLVEEMPGFLTLELCFNGHPGSIGIMVYEPAPGRAKGMLVQINANQARAIAGSLMELADRLAAVELDS